MTYVIITTTPEMASTVNPGQPWPRTTTSRTVPSLFDAENEVNRISLSLFSDGWFFERESGGSVGPLPDGTMIKVELIAAKS